MLTMSHLLSMAIFMVMLMIVDTTTVKSHFQFEELHSSEKSIELMKKRNITIQERGVSGVIPRGRFSEAWRCWGIMEGTNDKGKKGVHQKVC